MDTRTRTATLRPHWILSWSVKLPLGLIALAAILWSVFCLPIFADEIRLAGASSQIVRNIPVSDADLAPLGPLLERTAARDRCVPKLDHDAAIVRLRLAENAFVPDRATEIDVRMADLEQALRASLTCAPADPYLWLVLFWVKNTRNGLSDRNYDLLRMSYRLGPNEAWIARKRGALSLAMFDTLPPDLANQTVSEFARLLKSELYTEAIELMSGPGWRHRDRILAGLAGVPERNKAIFVKAMGDLGYELGDAWQSRKVR